MKTTSNATRRHPSKVGCAATSRPPLSTIHYPLSTIFCLLLLLVFGCSRPEDVTLQKPVERPLEGVKLRLAVVADPLLARAVRRVAGEWNAQTGSELEVVETSVKELTIADALPADALLCPSYLLGELAERRLLAPVPARILRDAEWGGIFELLKLREAAYGGRTMAVPFGSPALCCYYRPDLLEKLGRRPPRTWAEYAELAKLLAAEKGREERGEGRGEDNWSGTIEPLAPGWAGLVLLARAAPYAKHRDNYSTLFNIETMEPLVAGPPFVQALEELIAATKAGPANPFHHDPASARAAFWRGECGMALSWPTAAEQGREEKEGRGERGLVASATSLAGEQIQAGFAELPGSRRVFNLSSREWDDRAEDDDSRVPLLDIAGRLGVVGAKSANTDAAFQLLLWLSDSQMSPHVSAASPATTLFRQSNLKSPKQWVEEPVSATAALQYADATEAAFRHVQWLGALRLPGRAEYLAALDEAVAAAVRGEKSPTDALLTAEKQWREITNRLGLKRQLAAYRRSLGLEP